MGSPMGKELKLMKMEIAIQENGRTVNFMDREFIQFLIVDTHLKANGNMDDFGKELCCRDG